MKTFQYRFSCLLRIQHFYEALTIYANKRCILTMSVCRVTVATRHTDICVMHDLQLLPDGYCLKNSTSSKMAQLLLLA
jgi:hypothetical protein